MNTNCKTRMGAEWFARLIGLPETWEITDIAFNSLGKTLTIGINRPDWEQELPPRQLEAVSAVYHQGADRRVKTITWRHPSGDVVVHYEGLS